MKVPGVRRPSASARPRLGVEIAAAALAASVALASAVAPRPAAAQWARDLPGAHLRLAADDPAAQRPDRPAWEEIGAGRRLAGAAAGAVCGAAAGWLAIYLTGIGFFAHPVSARRWRRRLAGVGAAVGAVVGFVRGFPSSEEELRRAGPCPFPRDPRRSSVRRSRLPAFASARR